MIDEFKKECEAKFDGKIDRINYLPEFTELMEKRLLTGTVKYGDSKWPFYDNVQDILEEIIDIANYAYMFFNRIKYLEENGTISNFYVNPCRVNDISYLPEEERETLKKVFEKHCICYSCDGWQTHFCLTEEGKHERRTAKNA